MAFLIQDCKENYIYVQTEKARFDVICERYEKFLATASEPSAEPVKVFDSFNAQRLEELELIREVSKELQKKKIEDIDKQKAAQEKEIEERKEKEIADKAAEDKQLEEQETSNDGDKSDI